MSSNHPDAVDFGKVPIPVLLNFRWFHVEFVNRNPHEKKRALTKRWETTLLSAMERQCKPVERCPDCGCFLDRHPDYCPSEVAA